MMVSSCNKIRQWGITSLEEYIEVIYIITQSTLELVPKHNCFKGMLWFRGHAQSDYQLLPNLQRNRHIVDIGTSLPRYSVGNLWEEMRYQHFQARTHHLLQDEPTNTVGWTELSQHYGGKTRYLDWSESAIVSLKFALHDYLRDSPKNNVSTPCVWVLDPRRLNYEGYQLFVKDPLCYISNALDEFDDKNLYQSIMHHIKNGTRYFSPSYSNSSYRYAEKDFAIDGIPCLSALEDLASYPRHSMGRMLKDGDFNPYYFLLLRYYADGLPVVLPLNNPDWMLPPLAALQPYHSSRIHAQRGAFTIFPNYIERDDLSKDKRDLRSMEYQKLCEESLFLIRLFNPNKIAQQLASLGERQADLYSGIDNYARMQEG